MSEWHDIETAPNDGTSVIVCTDLGAVGEAKFHEEANRWYWAGFDPTDCVDGAIDVPTYWQPLPDPPHGLR